MRIAAAQLNQIVGDFDGNARRILEAARASVSQSVSVLVTPELSLSGYPPEDLLLRPAFYEKANATLAALLADTAELNLHLVVGVPVRHGRKRYNAALVLHRGRVVDEYRKLELPNYDVFDEQRYFLPDGAPLVFEADGVRFGVVICEDFWFERAPRQAREAGAQVLLALNGSPFHMDKQSQRVDVARDTVSILGLPMVAANLVGGQDELVFDGLSFALDARGQLAAQGAFCEPDLLVVDVAVGAQSDSGAVVDLRPGKVAPAISIEEQVYRVLVLGVRDYLGKNGFPSAVIGLSGGIDSALTLAIAVDALGADRVRAVMMPSPYTADISWIDSRDMVARVGVRYDEFPINTCFDAFRSTLADEFRGRAEDTTEENLQARIRGTLLMALSNKHGSIVLTTGNKSEMAVGYCTLYGDMAGGFAVIKDLAKTLVYRLSRWRNTVKPVIPERIITRAPSAELRPGQTDQDSLPPYDTLDAIMQMYMEQNHGIDAIVAAGHPRDAVERVVRLIRISEYKRRQAPVGIRVTHRAFGRDWRMPITSRFRD
ncbi:MAG: NAD+ synthase [Betaproteobacteria bacterium]|nr:NAD+ synthase [Betaproteobacteria bacterium]